jgi:prophage regulatory protein
MLMSTANVDRYARMPEVVHRTGLSRATIYRKMDRGEFPHSVRLSANVIAWYERDLQGWLANPMGWSAAA